MMKKIVFAIALLAFSIQLVAQKSQSEFVAQYQDLILSLSTSVNSKAKEKSWKDVEAGWKETVSETKTINGLCDAVVQFSGELKPDKGITNTWAGKKSKWNKDCSALKNWNELGEKLIEFGGYIPEKAWETSKADWEASVKEVNADYLENEKLRAPEVVIEESVFQMKFKELVNKSVDGIDDLKAGEPGEKIEDGKKIKHWRTPFMLPAAAGALVDFSEKYGVHRYVCFWNAGTSKENAKKIWKQIGDLVEVSLPANYNKKESYAREFVDSKKIAFEWNSTKFADVQKRPTVEIGVEKIGENYRVLMIFSEAFYKNQFKPEW